MKIRYIPVFFVFFEVFVVYDKISFWLIWVPHKIWARSVQPFRRFGYKKSIQTDREKSKVNIENNSNINSNMVHGWNFRTVLSNFNLEDVWNLQLFVGPKNRALKLFIAVTWISWHVDVKSWLWGVSILPSLPWYIQGPHCRGMIGLNRL